VNSLDAAAEVLRRAGKPLHYAEITRLMLDSGLWNTDGKTPDATINARLAVDIKRNGSASRFQRTGKGIFALRDWALTEYVQSKKASAPASDEPMYASVSQSAANKSPKMSFLEAAEYVLSQDGNREPMHYRDIMLRMLEQDLIDTVGQTPEATLYTVMHMEITKQTRRGETPRFVKHGKGYFGLRK
jgi:restriction system protein